MVAVEPIATVRGEVKQDMPAAFVRFLTCVLAGACGAVMLFLFLAGMLPLDTATKTLPVIIAFNAALAFPTME